MEDDNAIIAASAALLTLSCGLLLLQSKKKERIKRRRKRRWWMISVNKSRLRYNGSDLLGDLRKEPSGKFENFSRMSTEDFHYLLNKIKLQITKKDTVLRKAISAEERFAVTLRFLATGDSFQSLGYLFKISPQVISNIVLEVCNALISVLKDEIKLPKTSQEWLTIAKGFEELWNFPHCLGALDGKHIVIQSPFNSGSEYYNYKTSFSVVLMAAVDANYCFIYAEVECQGRISDGGVFKHTVLYDKLEREQLEIPLGAPLIIDHERTLLPFLFVADDAFPLRRNIMKPYPGVHSKGSTQRIFNYRLSRARRIVENAFAILAIRVFRKPMLLQPNKVSIITMTCILLHNFLRRSKTSSTRYTPQGTLDVEIEGRAIPGSWREDQTEMSSFLPLTRIARKPSMEAKTIRDKFAEYFNTSGKIEWQDKYC